MPKKKYNYPALKREFFESEHMELTAFLKEKMGKYSSTVRDATIGWTREKEKYMESIERRALQIAKEKEARSLTLSKSKLVKIKKTALELMISKLNEFLPKTDKDGNTIEGRPVSMKDIKTIVGLAKTELWEPTNITKQFNKDVVDVELTPEEQDIINQIEAEREKKGKNVKGKKKS